MSTPNGQMFVGHGLDAADLQRLSPDDVARQESRGLIPRFFVETRGRNDGTFFDVEMVEILVPGDAKSGPVRMVDESVKKRFAAAYRDWKAGIDQSTTGTPIQLLVGTTSVYHQLKAINIHTVEQLASQSEMFIDRFGLGGRELVERAKRVLVNQKTVRELQDAEDKDRRIASLEKQIADLAAGMREPRPAIVAYEEGLPSPVSEKPPEGSQLVTERPPPRRGAIPHKEGG